jgi:hypothetical protein
VSAAIYSNFERSLGQFGRLAQVKQPAQLGLRKDSAMLFAEFSHLDLASFDL